MFSTRGLGFPATKRRCSILGTSPLLPPSAFFPQTSGPGARSQLLSTHPSCFWFPLYYLAIFPLIGVRHPCHLIPLPSKFEDLKRDYADTPNVIPLADGHAISRSSDFIMYSVEAGYIDQVVKQLGPSIKLNAIVSGQTPVKEAFEKYLPMDTYIVSCHSLHGPSVNPAGQPGDHPTLWTTHALKLVESILSGFRSRYVHLTYKEHNLVTANTQAVTHAAFLSMGTAWRSSQSYPLEKGLYVGKMETVKVNLTLRIYSNKWHILNAAAREQIRQISAGCTELFKLMLAVGGGNRGAEAELRRRVEWDREKVFGNGNGNGADGAGAEGTMKTERRPILPSQEILDRFSMGTLPTLNEPPSPVDA